MTSKQNSKSESHIKEETMSTEVRVLNYQDENKSVAVMVKGATLWSDSPNVPQNSNQPMLYGPQFQQGYSRAPFGQTGGNYAPPMGQPYAQGYGYSLNAPPNQQSMFISGEDEDVYLNNPFFTKEIRNRFVQRVYTILTIQLLITTAIIALCVFERKTRRFILTSPSFLLTASIIFLVVYITLMCCPIRRRVPINFICLFILTVAMGITLGAVSTQYDTKIVIMAMGITAGTTLLVSIFAVQTSCDITECGPCLCVISLAVVLFGFILMMITLLSGDSMPLMHVIFAIAAAFLFTLFLMFDTQMIVGGRHVELSPEEYIAGSLQLYLSHFIACFWRLIQFQYFTVRIDTGTMPRSGKELKSPTEETLMSTGDNSVQNEKVRMKKQLGLLEGVAIILGIILGSGIFISPGGVIKEVDSLGVSLVVWILCGILSMIGAICYAELGTSIPKSGGDYAYIYEAFGPLPAFLYLWAANLIFVPTTNAIMGLTFANYVVKPFFPNCEIPEWGVSLLAAATICFLSFLNSYDVKMTTKLQIVFMFSKIAALATVICLGLVYLFQGNTQNFSAPFKDSVTDPGKISLAFYSGIFSYSGWSYLNFMTEELRDPFVNLPRAIYISIPLVTIIYVLANVAYGAVLTAQQMSASQAIAVDFAYSSMGSLAWMMPIMVAISAFGGLCVHIMTSSRMLFVGARNGHFPVMLSHINVNKFTPAPSLAFLNVLSLLMLYTSDIYSLITYCTIVETAFVTMSVSAILYLRWKRPKMARPIKVHIIVPIFFIVICIFLLCLPCYVSPFEVGMGLLITVSGIPAYYCGIHWKTKPRWFTNAMNKMTVVCQKIFMSAVEEKEDEDQ